MTELKPYLKGELTRRIAAASDVLSGGEPDTARRVKSLGFTNAANVKLVAAAEEMSVEGTVYASHYAAKYPLCQWVTWKFLTRFCQALDLRIDTAEHYIGVVPGEQLPYLEVASVESDDAPDVSDMLQMADVRSSDMHLEARIRAILDGTLPVDLARIGGLPPTKVRDSVRRSWGEFNDSFFVVGPKDVFDQDLDWRARFRAAAESAVVSREIGADPLVFRAVRRGALIVAAWGDEGDHIRASLRDVEGAMSAPKP